ncbi:hypothetical protein J3R83DRAFT_9546 [Lanmaoa asiatica]|nr:hypothetical protein J3R83DRAFT_9546 [Lanmaoa asiatica]
MSMDGSDYEGGDFAEESYDDLDHTPSGKRTKPSGYQLTNVLKLPRATTYSTQALYDQVHAGDIDLEPEYQRDVVWPESKQIGLIDSILRNFYVPPIIFVAHQHEDGSETKTCIDGKQRLTSIHRCVILCPDPVTLTGTKYWYKSSGTTQGGRRKLLPDRYRRLFANKQVVCIEYQDLLDSDEREIFQRVQLGMALTPAEKLQVLNTPMSTFVRKLQSEYFNLESSFDAEGFDWDRSRGGDFRCITQALYVIAKYPSSTSIGAITQLEKWLHNPTAKPYARSKGKKKATDDDAGEDLSKDDAFLERIHATFQTFSNLISDASLQPVFLKSEWRVSPIEFVMMCLLISVKKDKLTLQELAVKIGEMRVRVRAEHMDIRMNSRVAKTMFDFIKDSPDSPQIPEPVAIGLKRKREEEEVTIPERKEKDRREDEDGSPPTRSQVLSILPPPRPDRLLAVREAKKAIAPPRVTPSKLPTAPAALR